MYRGLKKNKTWKKKTIAILYRLSETTDIHTQNQFKQVNLPYKDKPFTHVVVSVSRNHNLHAKVRLLYVILCFPHFNSSKFP